MLSQHLSQLRRASRYAFKGENMQTPPVRVQEKRQVTISSNFKKKPVGFPWAVAGQTTIGATAAAGANFQGSRDKSCFLLYNWILFVGYNFYR
jgi:hypothetical protein